jgi:hypothetical protein
MNNFDFDGYVADLLSVWVNKLQRKLQDAIVAENLLDSGALYGSLKSKVYKNVLGATARAQMDLKKYGRVLDIKRPQGVASSSNETNRAALGITQRNRGRTWYNKNVFKGKFELQEMLLKDVSNMSRKEFLKWIQT